MGGQVDVWECCCCGALCGRIAYGGLALYAVSGEEGLPLIDATWRAWTYVADAGNHADSSGLGPRIVSVCISFGGVKGLGFGLGFAGSGSLPLGTLYWLKLTENCAVSCPDYGLPQ